MKGKKGKQSAWWRTRVTIKQFSADKFISRITCDKHSIIEAITERFNTVMRRNKVVFNLKFKNEDGTEDERKDVRAKQFTGRPLGEVTITEPNVGKVIIPFI